MSKEADALLRELLASRIDAAGVHCPSTPSSPPDEPEPDDDEDDDDC